MKKVLFVLAASLLAFSASAQVFMSKSGKVRFYSDAPLEKIEAVSTKFASGFSLEKKKLIVKIPITSFQFKDPLMMEHFNENYLESGKFPEAILNGVINENIDLSKDGSYNVTLTGSIEMHGISQQRTFKGVIKRVGNTISMRSIFKVKLEDHKISIPKIVVGKIAEEVEVTFETELKANEK